MLLLARCHYFVLRNDLNSNKLPLFFFIGLHARLFTLENLAFDPIRLEFWDFGFFSLSWLIESRRFNATVRVFLSWCAIRFSWFLCFCCNSKLSEPYSSEASGSKLVQNPDVFLVKNLKSFYFGRFLRNCLALKLFLRWLHLFWKWLIAKERVT